MCTHRCVAFKLCLLQVCIGVSVVCRCYVHCAGACSRVCTSMPYFTPLLHIAHCLVQCAAILCVHIHLGTYVVQVCICMASCLKLGLAAILLVTFGVGGDGFLGQIFICFEHLIACLGVRTGMQVRVRTGALYLPSVYCRCV